MANSETSKPRVCLLNVFRFSAVGVPDGADIGPSNSNADDSTNDYQGLHTVAVCCFNESRKFVSIEIGGPGGFERFQKAYHIRFRHMWYLTDLIVPIYRKHIEGY